MDIQFKNARWNHRGTIDCEINHPRLGWIPFTASPDDVEQHGRELFAVIKASGKVAAYKSPEEETTQKQEEGK